MMFSGIFFLALSNKRKDLIKLIFHISWLQGISFIYNPTASFFRYIVEWPWIEFKMRPMLFMNSWYFFNSKVVGRPVKLVCIEMSMNKSLIIGDLTSGQAIPSVIKNTWNGTLIDDRAYSYQNSWRHAFQVYIIGIFQVLIGYGNITKSHGFYRWFLLIRNVKNVNQFIIFIFFQ